MKPSQNHATLGFLTVIFFLFSTNRSLAQKGSLDLGVSFLWNTGMVDNSQYYHDLKSIYGFSSMLKLEYEPINRLRVSYGIGNLTKGSKSEITFTNEFGGFTECVGIENRLNYLSNELMIGGRIGNKLCFLPEIGVSFDALLKQEMTFDAFENFEEQATSNKEYYADWNTSLIYALSVRYLLTERVSLGLNFKVSNGLNSISAEGIIYPEGKPTNYLMGAAFIWCLKKKEK